MSESENRKRLPQEVAEKLADARGETPWEGLLGDIVLVVDVTNPDDVGLLLQRLANVTDALELVTVKLALEIEAVQTAVEQILDSWPDPS